MYAESVKNEEIVNLEFEGFMVYFNSWVLSFVERNDWSAISSLWYFKMYSTQKSILNLLNYDLLDFLVDNKWISSH
jgi:hypothetical protein